MNLFNESDFVKFPTSSGIDNNLVGMYNGRIVRVIKDNLQDYKRILSFCLDIKGLISSKLFKEDTDQLVIEHEKLEFITYYNEWTKAQQVEAAITVIKIQKELNKYDFFLFDPHAFNITFNQAELKKAT